MKKNFGSLLAALASAGLTVALGIVWPTALLAQGKTPMYEVDASWPKPMPDLWVTGGLGAVCIDAKDHVFITNRADLADNDLDAGHPAPIVIEFDPAGNVVNSFGDPNVTPNLPHGCVVDAQNNFWMIGSGDGIVQEYTHDGSKLLLQIGKRGVLDSSDGTAKGTALNSGHESFFKAAGVTIDPTNGDVYVPDGESAGGNHRVVVFDHAGHFLRQWELNRTEAEVGPAFRPVVHGLAIDNAGLVYVCDRTAHRIQVFDKMGNFKKNIPVEFQSMTPVPAGPEHKSGASGTTVAIAFSRDPAQKYIFVANMDDERIDVLDHATGQPLSSFGRPGHQAGEFTYLHFLAVDSKGNVYAAELGNGKRIQKFKLVGTR